MWFRLNPDAIFCSIVAFGSKSPASCSVVNASKGLFVLYALITYSRHFVMSRAVSMW